MSKKFKDEVRDLMKKESKIVLDEDDVIFV